MLTTSQEKQIKSLSQKKYRRELGLCIVEGAKHIASAAEHVEYTFTREDTPRFDEFMDSQTPQDIAAVVRVPKWTEEEILAHATVVVLDGVQDPGNVGTIIRLARAFKASLIFVESADPTSGKVIRSSAGNMFHTPWIEKPRREFGGFLASLERSIYRIEKTEHAMKHRKVLQDDSHMFIFGSEGQGIQTDFRAPSLYIDHSSDVESLNVGSAAAILLHDMYCYALDK
ncbi:MAG: RNA methyltransferase [bacterium]|nr:RNA methyltransferase [bacterium]